ncbi:MAG: type IV secretion system protein [Janthinobacterium lividum]
MKIILSVSLLCFISVQALAMTVHDPRSCAQAIKQLHQTASHYSKEINHWQNQINHLKEQSGLLKDQLASLTGLRELGNLEGELLSLMKELKSTGKHREALNAFLRSPDGEDHEYANEILRKYQMFDVCKEKGNSKLDHVCKAQILNKAGTIEAGEEIRGQTERKIIETSKIARKVKNTKDLKESQDLANAIALKNIEITQLKNQWDCFVDESKLREQLIEEKRREAFDDHQINAPIPTFE